MTPDLLRRYREPHRRYHDLRHVEQCLAELAAVERLTAAEREVLTQAIWFHDAVYDPTRSDNEERSAGLAEQAIPAPLGAEVARLVRLTADHVVEPQDRLGAILVCIDLSILGSEPATYEAYARAIREEYALVPEAAFRRGRAAFLRRMLAADPIYPDPDFADRLEARAKANMAKELAAVEAAP